VYAPADPGGDIELRARGAFQRRNFAIAMSAAEHFLGAPLDRDAVSRVGSELTIAGRLEVIAAEPLTILDAAHNPDGALALAEALPEVTGGREVVACIAILADKDAEAMVRALAPALKHAVCTAVPSEALARSGRPGARSHEPGELAAICEASGLEASAVEGLEQALHQARTRAGGPPSRALLVAGSHYVLAAARGVL
jgi:dihydrofolate synthase/folylpolyglutamate synthase